MSKQNSTTSSTFKSFSSSSFSSTINGQTTSRSETTYSDPSGTKVHRTSQNPGEAATEERLQYDGEGRRQVEEGAGATKGRITDVTEEEGQKERDRLFEERMEDEYAKREGGA